jgi:signal transduction histidine kinase/DNA-binding response OmpR family regulator
VQRIEISEKKILLEKAKKAHAAAAETNTVIGFFSVISVLLIICVAYLIVRLIRKIRKANVQLRIAKEKSDHLTESKSRFLANMSHEIRTPLNAIVGFADQMNSKNMTKEDVQKLEIIRKSAEHLTQITNDVLDFSKINSGALEIEQVPFSLKEEAAFVEQNIRELVIRNGNKLFVTVGNTVPDFVLGDPLRIRQVLLNLLGNAAKFTGNGEVELIISLLETAADSCVVRIEVRDTGIGIEPEQMDRIFEEFEQAETTTTREFGGTGLGLTITRRLVQLMKGKLEVRSVPGQETVFTIQLPFVVSSDKPKPKAVTVYSETGFLRGKRILIVDDEEYNRKLLISVLKDTGAVLSEAENGEVALEMLKQTGADVVLLDLRMPKMNGFDTRNAILKLEEPKSLIPVVALTAALSHEERIKMLESNWKGVLIKPLKKNDLLACLSGIFLSDSPLAISETPPSGKDNDVINLEPLKEISGSDTIFYLDMLRTLHRTTTDGLRAINQTSRLKDWEGMAEAAHKIAPPVKHIQAKEVYELLKMLERAGRSHAIDASVIESVQQLNRSMERMLEHLKEEIDRVG